MSMRPLVGLTIAALIVAAGGAAALPLMRAAAVAPADTPRDAEAVPLFPGLQPTGQKTMPPGGLQDDWGAEYPSLGGTVRTYFTAAPAEEVYAFYQQRLGGKIEHSSEDDHTHIGPGEVTPVIRSHHPHRLRPTENPLTNRAISSAMQRQLLSSNRPASAEGDWLQHGSFDWVVKDRAGAPTTFHVKVIDESVAPDWSRYTPRTVVEIQVEPFGPIADD
jgi:hypothetical protein